MLLHTIAGYDECDWTSCRVNIPDYHSLLDRSLKLCRLDIPRDYFAEGIDGEVQRAVDKAIDFSRAQSHQIVDISLPHTPHAISVYYIIIIAEASSNLARYNGIRYTRRSQTATNALDIYFKSRREGFESEVKRGEGGRKRGGGIGVRGRLEGICEEGGRECDWVQLKRDGEWKKNEGRRVRELL
jgi:aspartyl-tRNA(Asn)/glutamyl-tRNA(Gln) amidotransferase subunit A